MSQSKEELLKREVQVKEMQQAILQTAKRIGLIPEDALSIIGQATSDVVITISELAGENPFITLRGFGQSIINAADGAVKMMSEKKPVS